MQAGELDDDLRSGHRPMFRPIPSARGFLAAARDGDFDALVAALDAARRVGDVRTSSA
jgi:hypothetical protein